MKDLRKVKEENTGADVKVFTDHIPSRSQRLFMLLKIFIKKYYVHIIIISVVYALATHPIIVGQFFGDWWDKFHTSFQKECVK